MELSMTLNTSTRSTGLSGMTGIGTSDLCEHASLNGENRSSAIETKAEQPADESRQAGVLEAASHHYISRLPSIKSPPNITSAEAGLNSNRL